MNDWVRVPAADVLKALGTARARASGLLDWTGQPLPRSKPFQEMGVGGTAVFGGYVVTRERSPQWVGQQRYITSAELATNISIVAASVHYFLNLVAHPRWTVRPADDKNREAVKIAEFVDDAIRTMTTSWNRVIRRAAMYRFHGFGVQEWTAKKRKDGRTGFKDIEPRPQFTIEKWNLGPDGTVQGCWQRSPQTGQLLGLPRNKMFYLVEDTLTDSPEGLGIFRQLAEPYNRLKQFFQLEMRAYERDLRGIPMGRAPISMLNKAVDAGQIEKADAQRLVRDLEALVKLQAKESTTGLVLDSQPYLSQAADGDKVTAVNMWGFELLNGPGLGLVEVAGAIDRTQREMARLIGTEHLMMGDVGGNRALAEDKSRNLYLIANSVLHYIADQATADVITPLQMLNGWPDELNPTFEVEDVTFKNVDQVAGTLQRMAAAGAVLKPDDPVVNDVRDLLGVSRQESRADTGVLSDDGKTYEDEEQT